MHGRRKKDQVPLTPEKQKEAEELTNKISQQIQEFFEHRKDTSKLTDPFEYTSVMIKLCPEIQTIYNLRKELINKKLETLTIQEKHAFILQELQSLIPLMKQNPKSYCLWHHRKWCFIKGLEFEKEEPTIKKVIAKQEFMLCEMQLAKDERNFHVWNYRNWIVSVLKTFDDNAIDQELKFINSKLESNFSNFSALHFKSKHNLSKYSILLNSNGAKSLAELEEPQLIKDVLLYGIPLSTIKEELEQVKTGLYMQSSEQSMWLYHQWLIDRVTPIKIKCIKVITKTETEVVLGLLLSHKVKNLSQNTLRISKSDTDSLEFTAEQLGSEQYSHTSKVTVKLNGPVDILKLNLLNPDKLLEKSEFAVVSGVLTNCITTAMDKRLVSDDTVALDLSNGKNLYYVEATSDRNRELSSLIDEQKAVAKEILELEPNNRFAHSQIIYIIQNNQEPFSNTQEAFGERLKLNEEVVKSSKNLLEKNKGLESRFAYFLQLYQLKSKILEALKNGDLNKAKEIEQSEEAKSINLVAVADLLLLSDVKVNDNEVSALLKVFN